VDTLGSWQNGRSTFYTTINAGNCGYGTIPTSSFPYGYIGAANTAFYANDAVCGECYEVRCVSPWTNGPANQCNNGTSVIIKITDQCPQSTNQQWCSGDVVHFDLSQAAFAVIGNTNMGVIATQYRRTACLYTQPIQLLQASGVSQWWIKFWVLNVADWGGLTAVSIANSGSSVWTTMSQPDSDGGWVANAPSNGFVTPLSVRLTDTNGAVLTLTNVITSISAGSTSTSSSNFPLPTSSEQVSGNQNNFLKQDIYIVVAVVIIAILLIALVVVLRSKARARGTTMSGYIRESVAVQKKNSTEDLALAPRPLETISSQSELESPATPASPSQAVTATNFEPLKAEPEPEPVPEPVVSPAASPASEWETRQDESGQTYYYNTTSGVTQWEMPDTMIAAGTTPATEAPAL
jgi:hypothetical protein